MIRLRDTPKMSKKKGTVCALIFYLCMLLVSNQQLWNSLSLALVFLKATLLAIRTVDNLPMFQMSEGKERTVNDILQWLALRIGFQKGNVANQREHLILLLANMDVWNKDLQNYVLLDSNTILQLMENVFKNYRSWCEYLRTEPNLECPLGDRRQQSQLLYIGLYLLIWGEASNIRFMPECICYIFHRMAHEMYGTLFSNVEHVIGVTPETSAEGEEAFLRDVVTPMYEVMRKIKSIFKYGSLICFLVTSLFIFILKGSLEKQKWESRPFSMEEL